MMLNQIAFSAVALSDNPSFSELLRFSLTGLFVVLLSLGLLAIACGCIGYLFKNGASRRLPDSALPVLKAQDTDEIVAVIAAAVAEALAIPHRIVCIRGLSPEDMERTFEGRFQHHISHKLPRRSHTPPNR